MGVVSTSPPQTPNVWNPGPVRPSTNLSNLPAPSARPSFALAPSTTWEDQRRRLLRLRSEVDDLERILLLDPRSAFGGTDGVGTENAPRRPARRAGGSPGGGGGDGCHARGRQADLSSVVSRDMEHLWRWPPTPPHPTHPGGILILQAPHGPILVGYIPNIKRRTVYPSFRMDHSSHYHLRCYATPIESFELSEIASILQKST